MYVRVFHDGLCSFIVIIKGWYGVGISFNYVCVGESVYTFIDCDLCLS